MQLYAMRHGHTTYNLKGLCNDDPSGPATLTALGYEQAERAAQQLRYVALEHILCSTLPRTQQTAAVVNRHHHVPVTIHPLLNDIRSGFNDQPVADYFAATAHDPLHARINGGESADAPSLGSGILLRSTSSIPGVVARGPRLDPIAESLLDHKKRVLRFMAWLTKRPEQNLLVIAHEETMRVFAAYFAQIADAELRSLHFANCELKRWEFDRS